MVVLSTVPLFFKGYDNGNSPVAYTHWIKGEEGVILRPLNWVVDELKTYFGDEESVRFLEKNGKWFIYKEEVREAGDNSRKPITSDTFARLVSVEQQLNGLEPLAAKHKVLQDFYVEDAVIGLYDTNMSSRIAELKAWLAKDVSEVPDQEDIYNPSHYKQGTAEVIDITEHLNFNRGNAIKYLARAGFKKSSTELEDLKKALWYVKREIQRVERNIQDFVE